jgi:hypothetical protein
MRCGGHVARIGERKFHTSGEPKGNTTFGRFRCRWEDNIKMNLKEHDGVMWVGLMWLKIGTEDSETLGSTICGEFVWTS